MNNKYPSKSADEVLLQIDTTSGGNITTRQFKTVSMDML